jgi:hypothetical protein
MRRILWLCGSLALAGCGSSIDAAGAFKIWEGLESAQVAMPIGLDSFYAEKNFVAPVRCGDGGEAMSSVLQTHAFSLLHVSEPEGSVSGAVDYVLGTCRTAGVSLSGTVHRAFYAAKRGGVQSGDQMLPGVVRLVDSFYGSVELHGSRGACHLEATRTIANGAVTYQGELCGHPLGPLLRDHGHVLPTAPTS